MLEVANYSTAQIKYPLKRWKGNAVQIAKRQISEMSITAQICGCRNPEELQHRHTVFYFAMLSRFQRGITPHWFLKKLLLPLSQLMKIVIEEKNYIVFEKPIFEELFTVPVAAHERAEN